MEINKNDNEWLEKNTSKYRDGKTVYFSIKVHIFHY